MSWKKHFQSSATRNRQKIASRFADDPMTAASPNSFSNRFTSWLPEVYSGQPNRIERYAQYDNMDLDTEINMALDTIADSMTEPNDKYNVPFEIKWNDGVTEEDTDILSQILKQWVQVNDFDKRMWKIVRSILKYGDQFFIRDPDTYKLFWVSPDKIDSVIVDETKGKKPEQYIVRDLDANLQTLVASGNQKKPSDQRGYSSGPMASGQQGGALNTAGRSHGARFQQGVGGAQTGASAGLAYYVDSDNVIHMSLSEGLDNIWPFGVSILENVFKVYKQMELIEDAVIIYRVQRAPERRVFYVDTGRLPNHRAMAYLERIKNEIQQKRIPSRTGGQQNILDATYNPMCIDLSTKIPLLDGRTLTLNEIINEYTNGIENWVYSCDPITGKIVPGNITWAGITKTNAETVDIKLDNGKNLICTPDHKIPVLGKGFIEAQYLTPDDSLISYETKEKSLSGDKKRSYTQIFDHELNRWVFTHRMVAEFFKNMNKHQEFVFDAALKTEDKNIVHHKDYNRYNNNPQNLQWMNFDDHTLFHSFTKKEYWDNISPEESIRIKDKIRTSLEKYREENPVEFLKRYENRDMGWIQQMKDDDPEKYNQWRKNHGIGRKNYLNNNPEVYDKWINEGRKNLNINRAKNQTFNFTRDMLSRIVDIVKNNNTNRLNTIDIINNDSIFMDMMIAANPIYKKSAGNMKPYKFTNSKLKIMYKLYNFDNWKDFKNKIPVYNHKIVSINKVSNRDVGTITVDYQERWHNYHTFAIDAGIFVKNSMLEDYFFAQNADGKGSRVETLPGGDQLGQIDDMKYFHHKIRTGLRVPRSYMPDFDDGGGAIFNDGRVGTAYIEELRFTKYCIRLQNMIATHFDREFKLFCKNRGINIHASLFQLILNEPQNFSKYRQTEVDGAVLSVYSQVSDIKHISKSYGLIKYAGWTQEDVLENEKWWAIENAAKVEAAKAGKTIPMGDEESTFGDAGASAAGMSGPDGGIGDEFDMDGAEEGDDGAASVITGDEGGDGEELDL